VLGLIERGVGVLQHDLNVGWRDRGVDAGADPYCGQTGSAVCAELQTDALSERLGTGAVNAGQQHDELLASETCGDIHVSTLVGD
jgi:hypothetical protein